jgi:hypothetical protein
MAIDEGSYFYVSDGTILKNARDMLNFLNKCSDEIFSSHVNLDKNDLANWARDVLKEKRLAKKMMRVTSRGELIGLVEERLTSSNVNSVDKKSVISKLVEAIN